MEILQNAVICATKESLNIDLVLDSAKSAVDSVKSAVDFAKDLPLDSAFASKITLGDKAFIIAPNHAFLAQFAKAFLDSNNPTQSTLKDIAKEIANLIVGKAKVLFEEGGQILKLGLPELLDGGQIPAPRHFYAYKCGDIKICIYEI